MIKELFLVCALAVPPGAWTANTFRREYKMLKGFLTRVYPEAYFIVVSPRHKKPHGIWSLVPIQWRGNLIYYRLEKSA